MADPNQALVDFINNNSTHSKEDTLWAFIEGISAVIDGCTGSSMSGALSGGAQNIRDIYNHNTHSSEGLVINPHFVFNGHDDGSFKYTKNYLKNRRRKQLAGGLSGLGGVITSQFTQFDFIGMAHHGNATGTTLAHIRKLDTIAKSHKGSETIQAWLQLVMYMKYQKSLVRGGQFAGAAIPIGPLGMVCSVLATAAKYRSKIKNTEACVMTAVSLHWRAYQEQAISMGRLSSGGKVGPASNVLYELFTRRGMTRIFGKYDVDRIIKEPTGWMAISDKLLLI